MPAHSDHPPSQVRARSHGRLATLVCALCLAACGAPEPPRGVLLVSVDSLRADHLSCYGYKNPTAPTLPTSPHVDQLLAEEGLLFERAVSTTSWTLPAHMALLSGMPNELHGVLDAPDQLHPDHVLLAQVFKAANWRTAGFWSGPNVHPWWGFDRGFEEYVDCSAHAVPPGLFGDGVGENLDELRAAHDASHEGVTGPTVVRELRSWLDTVSVDERFFAFVHLWDVHYDYTPPAEHDIYDRSYTGTVDGRRARALHMGNNINGRDLLRLVSLYDGEVHSMDTNVGEILTDLEDRGLLDETLVVFTADHGEEFFEHTHFGHKTTLYGEVVNVPLIMRHPATLPAGRRLDDLVSIVDIAPTILDLCGLPSTARMWGRSLRPAWEGELEPRPAPMELTSRHIRVHMRGLHSDEFKVVQSVVDGRKQLGVYDLEEDPGEQEILKLSVIGAQDERLQGARQLWQELDGLAARYERANQQALPGMLQADLAAAGYTGGDEPEEDQEEESAGGD